MRLLLLGGTTEASTLARALATRPDLAPTLSFAGRTANPTPPPIPHRIGGFGGIQGLIAYLRTEQIDAVIDATHPFAAQMSRHAREACNAVRIPRAILTRPSWQPTPGDRWIRVPDLAAAATALGTIPRRVFLTIGGVQLAAFAAAPHHSYIVRSIDPPPAIAALPNHRLILARGPFDLDAERALLRDGNVDVLVTKNSGGVATEAKLAAARALGIEVIMIDRPPPEPGPVFPSVDATLAWLDAHRPPP